MLAGLLLLLACMLLRLFDSELASYLGWAGLLCFTIGYMGLRWSGQRRSECADMADGGI